MVACRNLTALQGHHNPPPFLHRREKLVFLMLFCCSQEFVTDRGRKKTTPSAKGLFCHCFSTLSRGGFYFDIFLYILILAGPQSMLYMTQGRQYLIIGRPGKAFDFSIQSQDFASRYLRWDVSRYCCRILILLLLYAPLPRVPCLCLFQSVFPRNKLRKNS